MGLSNIERILKQA